MYIWYKQHLSEHKISELRDLSFKTQNLEFTSHEMSIVILSFVPS